jgi:hypothetical protein
MGVFCNQKINRSRQRMLGNEFDDVLQMVASMVGLGVREQRRIELDGGYLVFCI